MANLLHTVGMFLMDYFISNFHYSTKQHAIIQMNKTKAIQDTMMKNKYRAIQIVSSVHKGGRTVHENVK
jgi:TPP-dependent 2-oxoacid decarboxylase